MDGLWEGSDPVHRLSGQDAGFLALELPIQPMNNLILAVLRTADRGDGPKVGVDLDVVRRRLCQCVDDVPAFRWRIVRVPLGLNHPVFVDDPDFDLDHHLREIDLPAPGGDDELDRTVADLAERCLDRRYPLWQLTLVRGLSDGRQAVVLKVHHCLMDGFATVTTLARIFAEGDLDGVSTSRPWVPEKMPRPTRLVLDALRDNARAARRLPALVRKTKPLIAAALAKSGPPGAVEVPRPGVDAPKTSINVGLTRQRRFARTSLPMPEILLVKDAGGASVNDVALALLAGSLRAYLVARGGLPAKPLLASVPVGMESKGAPRRTSGNRFSAMTTTTATDVDEPWARLGTIRTVTAESRRQLNLVGPELLADWLGYVPLPIMEWLIRRNHRKRQKNPGHADVNVVLSNVRGPRVAFTLGPGTVEDMYLVGPPNSGVGVNVTLWDYGDRMMFAILTFADSIATPGELADGLHEALAELVQLANARSAGGGAISA